MNLLEWYKEKSYLILSPVIEQLLPKFTGLRVDIQKARIGLSLREYVSIALATSSLVFLLETPLISFIVAFLVSGFTIATSVLFAAILSIAFSILIFFFFYSYPSIVVRSRAKKIDSALPFATIYMATSSGPGVPPLLMFRVLTRFEEYGEISREARSITRDCEFGETLRNSIKAIAKRSPSEQFKELLWGINTVIASGGNLSAFLHEKAESLMADYRRKLQSYSRTLSTMVEVYLTLVLVGSIFFVAMASLLAAFGMMQDLLIISLFLIILVVLPGISIGFLWLIRTLAPAPV